MNTSPYFPARSYSTFAPLAALLVLLSAGPAPAQLFDNLRALGGSRFTVGDMGLVVTNRLGDRVTGPKDIAVADFDGDGRPDFAVANKDGTVTVRFNLGDAKFTEPLHLLTVTNGPRDFGTFTFTNFATNVICNFTQTYVVTTLYSVSNPPAQYSNLTWVCASDYSTNVTTNITTIEGPNGLRGLAVADFTGDGRPDIAVASPGEAVIYLFRNLGGRAFAPAGTLPAWFGVRDLAAGDFDGDGLVDLAAAGTTNGVTHYRATGGGAFVVMTNLTKLASNDNPGGDYEFPQPAYYLRALRQPGETQDELIVSFAQRGKLWVLRAGADGRLAINGDVNNVFITALDAGPLFTPASSGVPDLVTSYAPGGFLEVYPATNRTQRFSGQPAWRLYIPGAPRNVRIVDLDHDGWNDLVVVSQQRGQVLYYKNNGGTFSEVARSVAGSSPREMDLGDFNGDGYTDLAVLNRYSSDVSILLTATNAGTSVGFLALDSLYPVDGGVSGLDLRDMNGDGRLDVVQLHRDSGEFSVRLSSASGGLGPPAYYSITNAFNPAAEITTDVNGDGRPDLVSANLSGSVTVQLGLPAGGFAYPQTFQLPPEAQGSLFALVPGDFDGDGKVDLAAGYLDCRVSFFRGDGQGHFTFTHTHELIYEPRSMVAADFDQNGTLDLAAAALTGQFVIVNNPGNLLDAPALNRTFYSGVQAYDVSMRLVDQNNDGDPDLLFGHEGGFDLFYGGPGLTFAHALVNNGNNNPGIASSTFVYADLNGDSRSDIASIGASNSSLTISLGTADGQFLPILTVPVPFTRFLAAGDVDGDGFADLVGSGDVLWVALSGHHSSNAPSATPLTTRNGNRGLVINEILPQNTGLPLVADGNRLTDWVEFFNGSTQAVALAGWRLTLLQLIRTVNTTTNFAGGTNQLTYTTNSVALTNTFVVATNVSLPPGGFSLLPCSITQRTPLHTGYPLPSEGATLVLADAAGVEADRVSYPALDANLSYARYQDGLRSFVVNNIPSPGAPNVDNGAVDPVVTFDGINLDALSAGGPPVRFQATARDDQGIVNLSLLWRRLDFPDAVTRREILYDDGINGGDLVRQDGIFCGRMLGAAWLPPGAEIQCYLECTDISGQVVTKPAGARFAAPGVPANAYTFAVGLPASPLEISEIMADNVGGLRDESNGTPPWIEIRNTSTNSVALAGVGLSQKFFGDSSRLLLTNVMALAPGQHLILYADGKPTQGPLHAPFKLNPLGDELLLTGSTATGARYLMDRLAFGPQALNTALLRLGARGPWVSGPPTPGSGNIVGPWRTSIQSNQFLFAYPTRNDRSYAVEYTGALGSNWLALPPVRGAGIEQSVTQPMQPRRFFRVREQ